MASTTLTNPIARSQDLEPERFSISSISWKGYQTLREEISDRAIHLTYDDGLLEFDVPSERHEQLKKLIGRVLEETLDHRAINYEGLASTTWNREDLLKGLEADECYYIQNFTLLPPDRAIDLTKDLPPDLAIEIEVANPSKMKLRVYAALGIPELWRVSEAGDVRILRLSAQREYHQVSSSEVAPFFPFEAFRSLAAELRPLGSLGLSQAVSKFKQMLAE